MITLYQIEQEAEDALKVPLLPQKKFRQLEVKAKKAKESFADLLTGLV